MFDELDAPAASWHYARDGQKAGPVPLDALRQLAGSGGLRPGDLVWAAGMAHWSPASAVPALAGAFAGPPAAPPPLPPPVVAPPPGFTAHGATSYGAPGVPLAQFAPAPDLGQDAGMRWLLPVGRSGWAIVAGYLGLFSILGCVGPVAIIVSLIAMSDIRKHPDRHGMGRAVFGLVMGILGTVAFAGFVVWGGAAGR